MNKIKRYFYSIGSKFDWKTATEKEKQIRHKYFDRQRRRFDKKCQSQQRLRELFVVPIGRLRKPLPMEWEPQCGLGDYVSYYPKCPRCGEMPYSMSECIFCGQRMIETEQPKGFQGG